MRTAPGKKLFIKTYGCQMNVYDSQRIAEVLAPQGYATTEEASEADLIVLNTCHIREKAAEKVYSELGRLRRLKQLRARNGGSLAIAVAGCVAQAEGEEMLRRAPAVDLVVGPQTYHRLPRMLARLEQGEAGVVETEFPAEDKFDALARTPERQGPRQVTAFLTIQEGCDKFCTFCVVPYTRGAEFSRPVRQIEAEAMKLASQGVREITLLGQNVNAYRGLDDRGRTVSLAALLTRLSRITPIDRLRYTTSHPRDMDEDLIALHGENPKVMPYLHLPVQAGSDRILKAMNRGHDAQAYIDLVAKLRKARPDLALSGDFIVGFPGESETDFEMTLALVRDVTYASAFSFKYSPRPGTPAAERDDQVPEPVKAERLARLQALLDRQRMDFNQACIGRRMSILLEKPGRRPGQLGGRSPYLQAVHAEARGHVIGDIVEAEIETVGANGLSAHIRARGDDSRPRHRVATEGAAAL
ncbi:MAG: tRNA (N6-isopentenyl adenosine(37)-C2)-methylthiotransferase MiaB [Rhizobiales bacterium]|nr:tRNA (N6-isopentenyl adenosine(37)-C2)-methylthiotransferase MiaB [Hyphomicrobiales bacterium]